MVNTFGTNGKLESFSKEIENIVHNKMEMLELENKKAQKLKTHWMYPRAE